MCHTPKYLLHLPGSHPLTCVGLLWPPAVSAVLSHCAHLWTLRSCTKAVEPELVQGLIQKLQDPSDNRDSLPLSLSLGSTLGLPPMTRSGPGPQLCTHQPCSLSVSACSCRDLHPHLPLCPTWLHRHQSEVSHFSPLTLGLKALSLQLFLCPWHLLFWSQEKEAIFPMGPRDPLWH